MNLTYRNINFSDAHEMQAIAAIDMTIPALFDSMFEVNEKTISERLQQLIKYKPDDFFEVVVTDDKKIVGYHYLKQKVSPHGDKTASIETIWVDVEFRKQGIGATLKARGEAWAKKNNLSCIETFVHAKNLSMQRLNQSLGFELVGYNLRKNLK